jgi:hypothetical protein
MSTTLVELYALKEAGASEEKARAAAESLVVGDDRLERIEEQTGRRPKMQDQLDRTRDDMARLEKDLAVIKAQTDSLGRMSGTVIAGVLALIIKPFFAQLEAVRGNRRYCPA